MKKRHISIKKGLLIGVIVGIVLVASLLYIYHTYWKGLYVVDNIPTSLTGLGIIVGISLAICMVLVFAGLLLGVCFPNQSKSEKADQESTQ